MLQSYESSETVGLKFRWRGMIICLAGTLREDGRKYLSVNVEDAGTAELITGGNTVIWIISSAVEGRSAAGACTTSDGAAPNAT